jgi:glyoxylase-like metal-dependent hydrolase (beta-lactamase superfamily II)
MRVRLLAAAVALATAPAAAQQQDFSKVQIRAEQLAPGVAVLFGAGGNIGLSYGEDGNVLIDDQFAPLTDRITAAVRTLDPDPVRFVVNTHWHGDHTGGNENFGKLGAVILAHDNVRTRMSTEQFMKALNQMIPASPKSALPVVTFGQGVTLHLNGDTIHVIHVPNAHTDGDSLVHWGKGDVLHMGDTYFNQVSYPFIDLSSNGSIDGLIAAVNRGLEFAGPNTKIIPGHGPMATRADLTAYRDMLVDVRGKVAAGIAAGQSLAQIQAVSPATRYGMPSGFIKPSAFVQAVYESLRSPPRSAGHSPGGTSNSH